MSLKQFILKKIPDPIYIKLLYRRRTGKTLNLKNPVTFNEKLQWLKLYNRKPEYSMMVDKYEVKKYVAKKIGEQYIIPTLGVWNHFDEIDFDMLPEQFVLKCTHDSGGLVIVKDKKKLDRDAARKKIEDSLSNDYYLRGREWPYKNVKPRIIAEKYMTDESEVELKDYKVFNFNGEAKFIQVDYGRFTNHKRNLYSIDWEYINAAIQYPSDQSVQINKPEKLDEMLMLARKLSASIPYVRTDFYSINDKIYFGEITFFAEAGFGKFTPEQFGVEIGSWIKLPSGGVLIKKSNWILYLRNKPDELTDYKFMCFNGKVKCSFVCSERFSETGLKITFFDREWNALPFERHYPKSLKRIPKPLNYEKMIYLAERLSKDIPFVRVDFYEISGNIYFGELTFFPGNGLEIFNPEEWDKILGSWIELK